MLCTDTFLRLPEENRARFLTAAWEEFSHTRYMDVSINQIIRKAGIPRGSFYQYFTGKDDLFQYLLSDVREQFLLLYKRAFQQANGDIFQTQLLVYDRLIHQEPPCSPLFDCCLRVIQVNAGLDLKHLVSFDKTQTLLELFWDILDLSAFRRQDATYIRQVFSLTAMALGSAVMDSLHQPEQCADHRTDLEERLELIKHGCLNN